LTSDYSSSFDHVVSSLFLLLLDVSDLRLIRACLSPVSIDFDVMMKIPLYSFCLIGVAEAFTASSQTPSSQTQWSALYSRPDPTSISEPPTTNRPNPFTRFQVDFSKSLAIAGLVALSATAPLPSVAADYGSRTPEQKLVAEAWRVTDSTFLDRTFNGQDWFKIRQDMVKRKYKSMDEARGAVSEMMSQLGDKYTRYLSPAKYQSMFDSATGTLAGIGVEIATNRDGRVIASDVEPNSPAERAGLKPKDIFLEGDGFRFDKTSTPDDVAVKLRGPVGSKVGVVVERDGETKDFIVTREAIKVTTVRSYSKGSVGVIRIKSFSATTAGSVKEKYEELKKKGAKSIVIDLRSNPGGLLPGGVDTASLFLEANKPVVFVVSNKGVLDAQQTFADGIDLETPLYLLVDHNTASAAEVFTAALKENDRAKVVGEQTFGKGIIQTIRGLSDGNGGLAVTVARYETPKRNDINKQGISVDITSNVECAKDDALACLPSNLF
jgi:carboxyl-terminal processing protease